MVRSVFYELVEKGEERELNGDTMLVVESDGEFFEIGSLDDAY